MKLQTIETQNDVEARNDNN